MPIIEITEEIELDSPLLILALSGWVDGGMVATKVGEHLSSMGGVTAVFDPDEIYDYQSHRPTLEIAEGAGTEIHFPSLSISAVSVDASDLLVVSGTEASHRWQSMAAELAGLASAAGVTRVIAVGAVPAMVPHTMPTPIITTSTDPDLEPAGIPAGTLVVPAALVNVLSHRVAAANGIPEIGFWAQVPHYVSGVYWPGVDAVLARMSVALGIPVGTAEIGTLASEMVERLDSAVEGNPEAEQFISELEGATPGFALEGDASLGDEVEDFLRSLGDGL